ncbi:MAG: DUF4145 domain-containing protein [Aquamicrobium sp.]|nr:DUF4145 domain-containing protein [Aquamicrobium sp.]
MTENPKKIEKAHCPTCNRSQNCDVHGHIHKPWEWSDNQGHSMSGGHHYTLYECRGCETVFLETAAWDENDVDYWYDHNGATQSEAILTRSTYPKPPSRPRPDWLDKDGSIHPSLHQILDETYKADEQNCHLLTLVGLRTALDSCVTALGIEPSLTFEEKLQALRVAGYIGDTELMELKVLTDAGNAAAHQGWSAARTEVGHLLDVLETFIKRVFVNGRRALAMKDAIPQRQRRPKKPKTETPAGQQGTVVSFEMGKPEA